MKKALTDEEKRAFTEYVNRMIEGMKRSKEVIGERGKSGKKRKKKSSREDGGESGD